MYKLSPRQKYYLAQRKKMKSIKKTLRKLQDEEQINPVAQSMAIQFRHELAEAK